MLNDDFFFSLEICDVDLLHICQDPDIVLIWILGDIIAKINYEHL